MAKPRHFKAPRIALPGRQPEQRNRRKDTENAPALAAGCRVAEFEDQRGMRVFLTIPAVFWIVFCLMRIALIRRKYAATGGAELYINRLIQELSRRGHEAHLFAEEWVEGAPCELHAVPGARSRAKRAVEFARQTDLMLKAAKFDCVFSLERTLRQDVYRAGDGLHFKWLEQQRRFAPLWKKPFVGQGLYHRRMLDLEAETFAPKNTRRVIVNSGMVGREISARFNFPSERIHLVRNGVNYDRFRDARLKRSEARKRFGLSEHDFVLLFVGSGWERKGLRYAIEALRALPDRATKLVVAGKGKGRWPNSSQIYYAGAVRDIEIAYAAADLFISLSIYDPSANATFEAMAAGLPVITTRFDGASELIQPGRNGSVIADPTDTPAVVEAIQFWRKKGSPESLVPPEQISLERNVSETVAVLELAAREKCA